MRKEIERAVYAQRDVVKAEQAGEDDTALLKEAEELFNEQSVNLRLLEHPLRREEGFAEKIKEKVGYQQKPLLEKSLDLQRQKQTIMKNLRAELDILRKNPDQDVWISKEAQGVTADKGTLWVEHAEKKYRLSFGDIIADAEWGLEYNLDKSVPLSLRKLYALELAKRSLQDLYNQQLAALDPWLKTLLNNKAGIDGLVRGGGNLKPHPHLIGVLAERIAYSFFLRKSHEEVSNLRTVPTDLYGDAHEKIDFILQKKTREYERGVRAEVDHGLNKIGIQFTKTKKPGKLGKKEAKVERSLEKWLASVDDIAILQIPGEWPLEIFQKWYRAGKPSGGPEQFLDEDTQREMFRGALERMFTPEEIAEQENRVFGPQGKTAEKSAA